MDFFKETEIDQTKTNGKYKLYLNFFENQIETLSVFLDQHQLNCRLLMKFIIFLGFFLNLPSKSQV